MKGFLAGENRLLHVKTTYFDLFTLDTYFGCKNSEKPSILQTFPSFSEGCPTFWENLIVILPLK